MMLFDENSLGPPKIKFLLDVVSHSWADPLADPERAKMKIDMELGHKRQRRRGPRSSAMKGSAFLIVLGRCR